MIFCFSGARTARLSVGTTWCAGHS